MARTAKVVERADGPFPVEEQTHATISVKRLRLLLDLVKEESDYLAGVCTPAPLPDPCPPPTLDGQAICGPYYPRASGWFRPKP